MPTTPWLSPYRPLPNPKARLFAFPYAGAGGSALRLLAKAVPEGVEFCPVELPGRWSRLREPLYNNMDTLQQALWNGLLPFFDRPCIFFGYSLGALVAFELARRLRREGRPEPLLLIAAARRAPQIPLPAPPTHHLADAQFLERLDADYGGVPAQLKESSELLELVLPVMRADMTIYETYVNRPEAPLNCRIAVFAARDDKTLTHDDLEAWQAQTVQPITIKWFPEGGHFFINSHTNELVAGLLATLSSIGIVPASD